jgi:hypothetical protein
VTSGLSPHASQAAEKVPRALFWQRMAPPHKSKSIAGVPQWRGAMPCERLFPQPGQHAGRREHELTPEALFLLLQSGVILGDEVSDIIRHGQQFHPLLAIECNRKASESSAGLSTRSPRRRFLCPCFRNQFDRREFCGSRRQAVSESAGDWADAAARTRIRPTPKVNVLRKFILVLDYDHFIGSASK